MNTELRSYQAVVWQAEPDSVGIRVTVLARNLEEAEQRLKTQHGEGIVFTLHNEEDAEKPR